RLLLRGPADLELRSVDAILLREGAASCFVSEIGQGFRIATDEMEVIDVGTAFSIDVHRDRESEVHVLEGSVEIKSPKREVLELKERHAIRMSDTGPIDVGYSPDRFPQPASLRALQRDHGDKRHAAWQTNARKLATDPTVLLHYTFDDAGEGSPIDGPRQVGGQSHGVEVSNHAIGSGKASNGAVIGCDWTEGRWPSKSAILYRNADDRVLFQVPGVYRSLTFMAWIRIDALTQPITSLMMTEAPSRRRRFASTESQIASDAVRRRLTSTVQSVRWELNQQQSNVLFSIGHGSGPPRDWRYEKFPAANAATNADLWGKWILVGVTCDTQRHQVVHYLNGAEIGQGELASDAPLLLDFMELGNFGISTDELERSAGLSQRRFYGAIDEVVIAERVFTPTELRSLWEIGRP
ncbi:MAG: LamG-like jellyroll fold domain-containing protein, partial [Rubripirellula sp.]